VIGRRLRGLAAIAFAASATSSAACWRSPNEAERRAKYEPTIAVVVLQDLMQLPPDEHDTQFKPSVFCAFVGQSQQGYSDPSMAVLGQLSVSGVRVVPVSACGFPEYRLKADDSRVAVIGVISIEWRRDDQVRVKAERAIGPLAGRGWDYTLSMTAKGWEIDNASPTWIS